MKCASLSLNSPDEYRSGGSMSSLLTGTSNGSDHAKLVVFDLDCNKFRKPEEPDVLNVYPGGASIGLSRSDAKSPLLTASTASHLYK